MAKTELDLEDIEFLTIGTIGPKGQRIFHLQTGVEGKIYTFTIEKEQAWALSAAIQEMIKDFDERLARETRVEMAALDMDLREPIQPLFRVSQMGLAYEASQERVVLVIQELTVREAEEGEASDDPEANIVVEEGNVVRIWGTFEQMLALSMQAQDTVEQGRPSPRMNGRITYYWM